MRPRPLGVAPEHPEVVDWNKEYADECDRLAELEARKTGKRCWGCWYLTKASLVTAVIRPRIGGSGTIRGEIYDIDLNRLNENWVRHMEDKNWIGEKGIRDLAMAISALSESKEELLPTPLLAQVMLGS
jgi:hypothetical protein